jgi:hypothetical protein
MTYPTSHTPKLVKNSPYKVIYIDLFGRRLVMLWKTPAHGTRPCFFNTASPTKG